MKILQHGRDYQFAHTEILPPDGPYGWGVEVSGGACRRFGRGKHFPSFQQAADFAADVERECAKMEREGVVI